MKFRTKPCEIEAVQWTGRNVVEIMRFVKNESAIITNGVLIIKTLEGDMVASTGDYIIRGAVRIRGDDMRTEQFEEVINNRIETCKSVLCSKAEEYATDDRLHNFKVAGKLQKCTAVKALGGMMAKHTVSVYDLIDDYEQGKAISKEMWTEKIGDSINYLLLLTAMLEEKI